MDLANFLNSMGANIMGAGTGVIKIRGVKHLSGADYSIIPDQIEAGTYMAAAVATRGDILVTNVTPKHLESIIAKLRETGAEITEFDESVRVKMTHRPRKCNVKTMPHPGFPDRYAAADSSGFKHSRRYKHNNRGRVGQPFQICRTAHLYGRGYSGGRQNGGYNRR